MNKVRHLLTAGAIMTGLLLYGCGSEPTATPVPVPTDTVAPPTATTAPPTATTAAEAAPTATTAGSSSSGSGVPGGTKLTGPAADLLNKSSEAMKDLKTFHFTIETSGDPNSANAVKGEGDFEQPDKAHLNIQVPGVQGGSVEMIVIGQDTYMKQPGSESYIDLSGMGNPLGGVNGLNQPQQLASFASFANSANTVGDETIDGVETSKIEFTYDLGASEAAAAQAAGTAATPDPALQDKSQTGQIWIEKSTGYLRKLVVATAADMASTPGTSGTPAETQVTLTYSKFNEPISPAIEKPANVTTLPSQLGTGQTPEPFGTPAP